MDNNTLTYILAAPALALLAIIPAFLVASREARKTKHQKEFEAFNAEVDRKREHKKREQKKAKKNLDR